MNEIKAEAGGLNQRMEAAIALTSDILDEVQDTLNGGRIKGIRIKLGKRTIREISVETAALSAILIAAAAVIISQLKIEVDR